MPTLWSYGWKITVPNTVRHRGKTHHYIKDTGTPLYKRSWMEHEKHLGRKTICKTYIKTHPRTKKKVEIFVLYRQKPPKPKKKPNRRKK